jgi:hypothetical protein
MDAEWADICSDDDRQIIQETIQSLEENLKVLQLHGSAEEVIPLLGQILMTYSPEDVLRNLPSKLVKAIVRSNKPVKSTGKRIRYTDRDVYVPRRERPATQVQPIIRATQPRSVARVAVQRTTPIPGVPDQIVPGWVERKPGKYYQLTNVSNEKRAAKQWRLRAGKLLNSTLSSIGIESFAGLKDVEPDALPTIIRLYKDLIKADLYREYVSEMEKLFLQALPVHQWLEAIDDNVVEDNARDVINSFHTEAGGVTKLPFGHFHDLNEWTLITRGE